MRLPSKTKIQAFKTIFFIPVTLLWPLCFYIFIIHIIFQNNRITSEPFLGNGPPAMWPLNEEILSPPRYYLRRGFKKRKHSTCFRNNKTPQARPCCESRVTVTFPEANEGARPSPGMKRVPVAVTAS